MLLRWKGGAKGNDEVWALPLDLGTWHGHFLQEKKLEQRFEPGISVQLPLTLDMVEGARQARAKPEDDGADMSWEENRLLAPEILAEFFSARTQMMICENDDDGDGRDDGDACT